MADTAREGARFGVNSSVESIDMSAVLRYQQGVVSRLHKGLQGLVSAATIDYVDGFGEVTSPTTVRVGDRTLTGRRLVLATGSRARSLPGLEIGGRVLTSDQALGLTQVPTSVIVLGGGVIGVEFASVFRSFGASVTIIEALPRLVPAEEESISKALERAFRKRGIVSRPNARFASVAHDDASVTVSLEDGSTLSADLLLVAVGREPVSDGMGFQEAGVHTDRGFVPVSYTQLDVYKRQELHVVVSGRQAERIEHLVRSGPLNGDHGIVPVPVDHLDALGSRGLQPTAYLCGVRGVGDEEDVVVGPQVLDEVVDDPARGVAAQRVLRLTRTDPAQVVGEARVDEVGRTRPGHRGFAQVAHVEDPDPLANRGVFGDHSAAGVFDGHLPPLSLIHI